MTDKHDVGPLAVDQLQPGDQIPFWLGHEKLPDWAFVRSVERPRTGLKRVTITLDILADYDDCDFSTVERVLRPG